MYVNYGDRNFFEYGRLVDADHSDTEFPILCCEPFSDVEDLYLFGDVVVDVTDSWIDEKAVCDFIGCPSRENDPVQFALGCLDYYGVDVFGDSLSIFGGDQEEIKEILRNKFIASDNLDMNW